MTEPLVWKDQVRIDSGKAATHAAVIGVGHYPHLLGGGGPITEFNGGLGQLTSPPESAYAVARWLLDEFNNPDTPMASLSLLVSAPQPSSFSHAKLASPVTPALADSWHVVHALRDWIALGDSNEQNLMLFFFCGHGVARGLEGLTLLLRDYGQLRAMPMEGAIDFAAMQRGMARCAAAQQCFFVDACRTVTDIARNTTSTGQQVIQDDIHRPFASDWNYAVLYSTVEGEAAYGRRDKPSFYTEELIRGLNGGAANNRNADGRWRVGTSDLNASIHRGLSLRGPKIKNSAVRLVEFEFHLPKNPPLIPVTVFCDPRSDTGLADLSCWRAGEEIGRRGPEPAEWRTELPSGVYDFKAEISTRSGQRAGEIVVPPYRDLMIQVPK